MESKVGIWTTYDKRGKRPPRRLRMSHSDFKRKYIYKIKGYFVNYNLYPLKT